MHLIKSYLINYFWQVDFDMYTNQSQGTKCYLDLEGQSHMEFKTESMFELCIKFQAAIATMPSTLPSFFNPFNPFQYHFRRWKFKKPSLTFKIMDN